MLTEEDYPNEKGTTLDDLDFESDDAWSEDSSSYKATSPNSKKPVSPFPANSTFFLDFL